VEKLSRLIEKYFAFFIIFSDLAFRIKERTKKRTIGFAVRGFLTIWYYSVACSLFIFVRLTSNTTSIFRRFFIWQAIVRRPSVSTEGLFISAGRSAFFRWPPGLRDAFPSFRPKFPAFSPAFFYLCNPFPGPPAVTREIHPAR